MMKLNVDASVFKKQGGALDMKTSIEGPSPLDFLKES